MKKNKLIKLGVIFFTVCLVVTGCGNKASLKNNHTVVNIKNGKITADTLYEELRDKYGISTLIDMIDHKLFDKKYKTTDDETKSIDSQIKQMKSQYNDDEDSFLAAIKQYLGVSSEEELRSMLSLEYKRNLAVEDYVKSTISDDEVKTYYDNEIVGDMKVRHILIKATTTDDMSDEEKEAAEDKAKKKAESLIKKLDNGEDFSKLAKKYSDDEGSAKNGGLIDYFNKNDNMDEAFLNASIDLKKGKYTSEPVKSAYGYHIILKVDQKKKKSLKKTKKEILSTLCDEKLNNDSTLRYTSLKEIRKKNGVSFKDDALKKDYDELMDQLIENASSSNTSSN